ncbi:MAG: hypothetical protein IT258_16350 [Saprospiraceae bacterium]|nr:hypothetical protein [Saprospiraceae bacterium]
MKNFNFFSQLFSLVIFCFATTIANAQVKGNSNFYDTGNPYTYASTDGMGSRAVVALIKPNSNQIRVSTYTIPESGEVTWNANYDFGSATSVKVAMLSETRVVVGSRTSSGNYAMTIFDINATTGALTKKGDWTGGNPNNQGLAVIKLSPSSFAISHTVELNQRISTFAVDANGNITFKSWVNTDKSIGAFDIVRLSDNRLVYAGKTTNSYVKFVCFDVAAGNLNLSQKGFLGWNNQVNAISLANYSNTRFVAFAKDTDSHLDVLSLYVSDNGSVSNAAALMNVKKPENNDYLEVNEIAPQKVSSSKILLGASLSNNKLAVIPFSFNVGAIAAQTGGYYPNAPFMSNISSGFITGERMVSAFKLQDSGKFRVQSFKWQ